MLDQSHKPISLCLCIDIDVDVVVGGCPTSCKSDLYSFYVKNHKSHIYEIGRKSLFYVTFSLF